MDIIKKNLISIVCGVLAIIAIIATYFPLGGKNEELQKKLESSASNYTELNSLKTQKFNQPQVDPNKSEVPPLGQFPTAEVVKKGKDIVDALRLQADRAVGTAVGLNKRTVLVPELLPNPHNNNYLFQNFFAEYNNAMAAMVSELNAVMPVSLTEVDAERTRIWNESYAPRIPIVNGQEVDRAKVETEFNQRTLRLDEELRFARARQGAIFLMTPASLYRHPRFPSPDVVVAGAPGGGGSSNTGPILLSDVWAAQLSLWIDKDVVAAISAMNATAGSTVSVPTAPIKNLVSISFADKGSGGSPGVSYVTKTGYLAIAGAAGGGAAPAATPAAGAPPEDPQNQAVKEYRFSPTGRVCNNQYDVVHFSVRVDMDARFVQQFMLKLTSGRFITVRECDIIGVDRDLLQAQGFNYGKDPVVRVALRCEAVFLREWTIGREKAAEGVLGPITQGGPGPMPLEVRRMLGVPPATNAGGVVATGR